MGKYVPLENITILFCTDDNISVCADEWGDLYYTDEIPAEFVIQGQPYPRSACKPLVDLPAAYLDDVMSIYKKMSSDLIDSLICGEEHENF